MFRFTGGLLLDVYCRCLYLLDGRQKVGSNVKRVSRNSIQIGAFENAVAKTCAIICIVFNRVVKRGRTWSYEGDSLALHGLHANLTCWTS